MIGTIVAESQKLVVVGVGRQRDGGVVLDEVKEGQKERQTDKRGMGKTECLRDIEMKLFN